MCLTGRLKLNSGFCFDYTNMLGDKLIKNEDIEDLQKQIHSAIKGLEQIRAIGYAKGHLSKEGEIEPVYFTRLAEIKDGNPNTPESINRIKEYSKLVWDTKEVVIFFGIGGSYLGNKVLFDIEAGSYWNQKKSLERKGFPKVFFSGNNLDASSI